MGRKRERESALFFLPSSEREWPLKLCISLESVHPSRPPLPLSGAGPMQAAACPALAIQAQVQSTAGERGEKKQTERRPGGGGGADGGVEEALDICHHH